MFKAFVLILALAAYGAYALLANVTGASAPQAPSTGASSNVFSIKGAAGAVMDVTAHAAGLKLAPIPSSGCSDSALPPDRVVEILNEMPDGQRVALAKLLDLSSSVWTAQMYNGPDGTGFCLPVQGTLVLMPDAVQKSQAGLASILN